MRLLLDTHVILWAAGDPDRLPAGAHALIEAPENRLFFSSVSLWEIVIKNGLERQDFRVDAAALRQGLLANGYEEIPITGGHAIAVAGLPPIHKDPFDRMLIAQALVEGLLLLTLDATLGAYPGPVRLA